MNDEKDYWFAAKQYGWGWSLPVTWQGWAVVAAYVASLAVGFASLHGQPSPWPLRAWIAAATLVLIIVVAAKGERPLRWRWGMRR